MILQHEKFSYYTLFFALIMVFKLSHAQYFENLEDPAYQRSLGPVAPTYNVSFTNGLMSDFSFMDLRSSSINRNDINSFAPISVSGNIGAEVRDLVNRNLKTLNSEVQVTRIFVDNQNYTHVSLQQYLNGYRVIGATMVVHVTNENQIDFVNGNIFKNPIGLLSNSISEQAAKQIAVEAIKVHSPNKTTFAQNFIEKVIYEGRYAYEVHVDYRDQIPVLWICYVDINSGELLYAYNNPFSKIYSVQQYNYENNMVNRGTETDITGVLLLREGGETVKLKGTLLNGKYTLQLSNTNEKWSVYDLNGNSSSDYVNTGVLVSNSSSTFGTDKAYAISAAYNISFIIKNVTTLFGIKGWDGKNGNAPMYVNWGGTNAMFMNGQNIMVFGNGIDSKPVIPMDHGCVLDIMAHEFGHGITQLSGQQYTYQGESGAINESMSDNVGVAIEFLTQKADTAIYPKQSHGKADWLIGEDAIKYLDSSEVNDPDKIHLYRGRDIRDPWRSAKLQKYEYRAQPKYYKGKNYCESATVDQGGVHINSSMLTFPTYLVTMGTFGANGKGKNLSGEYIDEKGAVHFIKGLGGTDAFKIHESVNLQGYVSKDGKFAQCPAGFQKAAEKFGKGVIEYAAAFTAVGLITQKRSMSVSKKEINFGTIKADSSQTDTILLANTDGKDPTIVYSVSCSDSVFMTDVKTLPLVIAGGNSAKLTIVFKPSKNIKKETSYDGTITIKSNATDSLNRVITITVKGVGVPVTTGTIEQMKNQPQTLFTCSPNPANLMVNFYFKDMSQRIQTLIIYNALGDIILRRTYRDNATPSGSSLFDTWKPSKQLESGVFKVTLYTKDHFGNILTHTQLLGINR